jgi:hypothetical protein
LDILPDILKGHEFPVLVNDILTAYRNNKAVIFAMGAHVIKCGLSPLIIELMKKRVITMVALNGAGVIHDFEIALTGATSEDVEEGIQDGSFGMAEETAYEINNAIVNGVSKAWGIGRSVGERICNIKPRYKQYSILATGFELGIPVCVHVAIGTDIIHQHPTTSGAATGEGSYIDFRILTAHISNKLDNGGVFVNIGSAVILPEVFLKALNICRNLGYKVNNFVTANFDMISHYRSVNNVVTRPVVKDGKGYSFIGHHEIMIPLLVTAIIEQI